MPRFTAELSIRTTIDKYNKKFNKVNKILIIPTYTCALQNDGNEYCLCEGHIDCYRMYNQKLCDPTYKVCHHKLDPQGNVLYYNHYCFCRLQNIA